MLAAPRLIIGHVMHRRLRPAVHAFVYPVFYVQLPLRNLAAANCGIFSLDRWNLLSFQSRDHGPRDGSPLLPWIRQLLRTHGLPDDGEIMLQAFPRVLGFVFNPVSFWFCHDRSGALIAVLAEVNNTFGGTHSYLLHNPAGAPLADGQELQASKVFHVSPFCVVEGSYRFRFRLDAGTQVAHIDYYDKGGAAEPVLLTAISGKPRHWTSGALWLAFLRMPLLTFGVIARIHWQALKLWLKKVPFRGAHSDTPAPPQPQTQQEPTR
ncbi:MAG: DUF1365 domain-containing protein [Rhodocyclaceae bacterium]|nr:DUF1365 domain-containing protein [Rhodocyclaceae bacterium]